MNSRLKKAYDRYATLDMQNRNSEHEICLALHTDNEAIGEVRLVYNRDDGKVHVKTVYPDGSYHVITSLLVTDDEVAATIDRSDPAKMRQCMLALIVRECALKRFYTKEN